MVRSSWYLDRILFISIYYKPCMVDGRKTHEIVYFLELMTKQ